jgi:hypothetical protein
MDQLSNSQTTPATEQAIYEASAEAVTAIKNRLHVAGLQLQHHEALALVLSIRDSIRDYIGAAREAA